jgi:cardiolipin hydrolase
MSREGSARAMTMEEILRTTLEDGRLTRSEKQAIDMLLSDGEGATEQQLSKWRHEVFAMAAARLDRHEARQALDWLEQINKCLLPRHPVTKSRRMECHFSPGPDCAEAIMNEINRAQHTIDVCVFTITDDRIGRVLLNAKGRGVRVRIISDDQKAMDLGSDVMDLQSMGIDVRFDVSRAHMHHKFALFDSTTLLSGSYNWTRSAARENQENVVVTDASRMVSAFAEEFSRLWALFE